MKNIIALTFLILIVGCAPPALVKKEASSTLGKICLDLFSCGMPGCYNYGNAPDVNDGSSAFAFVNTKNGVNQTCGWAHASAVVDLKGSWTPDETQELALQKCEESKSRYLTPNDWNKCEIYAIGWNIVYKKKTDVKVKKSESVKQNQTVTQTVSTREKRKCVVNSDGSYTGQYDGSAVELIYKAGTMSCKFLDEFEVYPQNETKTATPTPKVSIDDAKSQCSDIGFKAGTEKFGECVLELNR